MSQYREGQEIEEETGLNLFDDKASAAGSFPNAMLGYDRVAVDSYVREIEGKVSELKFRTRDLERELSFAKQINGETDFERLGAHAKGVLQAAELQAQEIIRRSEVEADKLMSQAQQSATALRQSAQQEADDLRLTGLSGLRKLRQQQASAGKDALENARRDAELTKRDSEFQAKEVLEQVQIEAAATLEAAKVEASAILNRAKKAAADQESATASEVEATLAKAAQQLDQAKNQVEKHLAASRLARDEANQLLSQAREEAAEVRAEAVASAEEVRVSATRETEALLLSARDQAKQAAADINEQQEKRKGQLERDITALEAKRDAIVAAMSNLGELAAELDETTGEAEPTDAQ